MASAASGAASRWKDVPERVSRGYRLVLANPGQRLIGAVLAVAILGSMAQTTYFSLWLAHALGADATGIALAFAVLGVAGAVTATLAGMISDWLKQRRVIIVGCLALGGIAMLGQLTVHSFAAALVPIALTTASPAALGLTMALAADLGRAEALENASDVALVVGTQRVSWQFGSILGPGLGALAVGFLGRPADAILAGGLATLVAAGLALRLPDLPRQARPSAPSQDEAPTPLLPLILLMLAATLANAPVFSRIAYLSLYITGPLGLSPTLVSPAFALSSLIGFFTLSITGACVARWGALPVAIVVTLLAVVYGGVEGLAQSYGVVLAAQVVLGISYMNQPSLLIAAQEMAPSSNGLASGMQAASQALRSILGLLVLAPLVPLFGLGGTFLASGGLALIGIGLLIVVHRMTTRCALSVAPQSVAQEHDSYGELER